ncbi:hypothetical protein Bca52824_065048 [Brassica carinata]|uniref:Uncharacterized protein n=1 Tax=Brassica carinata TaxID=52824 RepID=A0A8X7QIZ7_BRACI|nr:hypothetical protein Bca52824_065048 [Brassica carinata]
MSISDVSECVVFVDFNGSVTKMKNVTAAEVSQLMNPGAKDSDERSLPQCLKDLVGRTYAFQLKLSAFNFTSREHIFDHDECPPQPNF